MPSLHTLTGNLLWEQTLCFDSWEPGRTQRARSASFQAGGKGVNVSRMLARLGTPAAALCLPGGATGAECESWIRARGIDCRAFRAAAPTRTGLVVRAPGRAETTFLGPDSPVDAAAAAACAAHLDACPAGDVLAVCGSIPGWAAPACEPLRTAFARWIGRGPLVADTYGPPLAWLAGQPLAWIKVNRAEFEGLWPEGERAEPIAARLAAALRRWPARAWIVTDGPRPVWLAAEGRPPGAFAPPPIAEVSATGSGDVLQACLIHAVFCNGLSLAEALPRALPYAAANAASAGIADFPLRGLPDLGSGPL